MLNRVNICKVLVECKGVKQRLTFIYTHPTLHIALNTWQEVYLLKPRPIQLFPEVHRGKLIYRAKGYSKRISYTQIKTGLVKKDSIIEEEMPDWL